MIPRKTLRTLIAFLVCLVVPNLALALQPSLSASLLDRDAKAKKGWATVEVRVYGLDLVDSPTGQPQEGEGHLHYRVDDGFVVATTATKLGFHGLAPGKHHIEIRLVGNDHLPLGPVSTLEVTVTGSSPH